MDYQKYAELIVEKLQNWGETLVGMLPNLLMAMLVFVAFVMLARMARRLTEKLSGKVTKSSMVTRLASSFVYLLVFGTGAFVALSILNLDKVVTSLLAGAGIAGLALSLAFQDIAGDIFAGIIIALRRPFKVGHLIQSNEYIGIVQHLNLRTTNIQTFDGQEVLIPNKDLLKNPLVNYYKTGVRRLDLPVGVSYGDDLAKVKQVTLEAAKTIPQRDTDKEPILVYEGFGDSSINFVLMVWLKHLDELTYLEGRSEAVMRIKKAYDENDVTIPFPIRTLDFGIKGGETLSQMQVHTVDGKPGATNGQ